MLEPVRRYSAAIATAAKRGARPARASWASSWCTYSIR